VIPRAHITAWRPVAPWSTNAQVEQDLILSRAIIEIFSDPRLASTLVFRGGTALHKLFLSPPARYSEDIDLVQAAAGPIGAVMDALRARLDPWLGKPKRDQKEGSVRLIYRFQSEIPPITPLRLKVEINTREQFSILGPVRKELAMESPWFSGKADTVTYAPEELLGTKLRALYQRKKGRDLFDMATALRRLPALDPAKVVDCFARYLAHTGKRVSRAEYEANMTAKLDDPAFREDILPLLARDVAYDSEDAAYDAGRLAFDGAEQFDAKDAWTQVHGAFVTLLPGEPWRRPK
jgi:predicted nucleotidyltransferase component of viral defense system